MFTRIVECRVKPDKRDDFNNKLRNEYNRIVETLKPTLRKDPIVETFNVETSTTHRIASGKAA